MAPRPTGKGCRTGSLLEHRTAASLRDVELTAGDFSQDHLLPPVSFRCPAYALQTLSDIFPRHQDAVALQDLLDDVVVILDRLGDRKITMLPSKLTLPEIDRRHPEKSKVSLCRLDEDNVTAEVWVFLVLAQPQLES